MTRKKEKLIDRFIAASDDGRQFTISIYQTMLYERSLSGPSAPPIEGLKEARTSNGYHCNFIDADRFEIVELGLEVKRLR